MSVLAPDRVLQTSTTLGVADYALAPVAAPYRAFRATYANGVKVPYCATDNQLGYEIGIGTLVTGTPDTLQRSTIFLSSNSNVAVSWPGTTKQIFAWEAAESAYVATKSGAYIAALADWGSSFVFIGGSTVSLTLPALSGVPSGWAIRVKNSGSAAWSITPHTGDQIEVNGVSTAYPLPVGGSATMASDGTVWRALDFGSTTLAGDSDVGISGSASHDFLTFNAGTGKWINSGHASATSFLDAMVGDSGSGGTKGLAPAPAAGDAAAGRFLKADGTYAVPAGAGTGTPATIHRITSGSSDSLTAPATTRTHIIWNSSSGASKSQTIPDPTLYDGYDVDVFDFFGDSSSHPITMTPAGTGTITVASLGSVANLALQSAYGNLSFRAIAALNTWIVT